eukprot:826920_1
MALFVRVATCVYALFFIGSQALIFKKSCFSLESIEAGNICALPIKREIVQFKVVSKHNNVMHVTTEGRRDEAFVIKIITPRRRRQGKYEDEFEYTRLMSQPREYIMVRYHVYRALVSNMDRMDHCLNRMHDTGAFRAVAVKRRDDVILNGLQQIGVDLSKLHVTYECTKNNIASHNILLYWQSQMDIFLLDDYSTVMRYKQALEIFDSKWTHVHMADFADLFNVMMCVRDWSTPGGGIGKLNLCHKHGNIITLYQNNKGTLKQVMKSYKSILDNLKVSQYWKKKTIYSEYRDTWGFTPVTIDELIYKYGWIIYHAFTDLRQLPKDFVSNIYHYLDKDIQSLKDDVTT